MLPRPIHTPGLKKFHFWPAILLYFNASPPERQTDFLTILLRLSPFLSFCFASFNYFTIISILLNRIDFINLQLTGFLLFSRTLARLQIINLLSSPTGLVYGSYRALVDPPLIKL
jgi:hypothetical protein